MKLICGKTKTYESLLLSEKFACSHCVHHEAYKTKGVCERGEEKGHKNCGLTGNKGQDALH